MSAKTRLIDAYTHAARKFQVSEKSLVGALDSMDARKATGDDITAEFTKAQRVYRECNTAWDTLELARRAYWLHVAKEAEQQLESLALPLLATINHAHAAGRSGISAPSILITSALPYKELPRVDESGAPVPIAGIVSDAIDRAEEGGWLRP